MGPLFRDNQGAAERMAAGRPRGFPQATAEDMSGVNQIMTETLPGIGDVLSARDAYRAGGEAVKAYHRGDKSGVAASIAEALAGGAGALPFIPNLAGIIKAYHGSPHKFDKFSMDKIGTGEGAQAFGHGLYFAENPKIAKEYQDNVLDMDFIRSANDRLREISRELGQYEVPGSYGKYKDPRGYELKAEYDDLLEKKTNRPGNFYEVTLQPDHEDLLDWDAPLNRQPEKAQVAIAEALEATLDDPNSIPMNSVFDRFESGKMTGEEVYRALEGKYGQREASRILKDAGVPGLRYLDAGSRTAKDGTRNIVMFDDNLVSIDRVE